MGFLMNKMNVLVTGGAGYIGSHMVHNLLDNDYNPIVFDNLSSGKKHFVPKDVPLVIGDLRDYKSLEKVFSEYKIDAVMHFAGLISVGESVQEPLKYNEVNVSGGINLLKAMQENNVNKIIFSSTAAVYESDQSMPLTEDSILNPANPYGKTKLVFENIIQEVAAVTDLRFIIFRYFNAGGSMHERGIGESHFPETHLIPNILQSLKGKRRFYIFGEDYATPDGTCIRDYIHVKDICQAHLAGLKILFEGCGQEIFNIGTGRGYTVKEVMEEVTKLTEQEIDCSIEKRRDGDAAILVASANKAKEILNWTPKETLKDIIESAFAWEQKRDI